jgi:PhnB protein
MGEKRPGLIPFLIVEGASEAVSFYGKAFGAQEILRTAGPDGRVVQFILRINGGVVYVGDMFVERGGNPSPALLGGTPVTMHIETDEPDAIFDTAIAAGATPLVPMQDMFWGQRFGKLLDPFGHRWAISTPGDPVDPDDLDAGLRRYFR